jgi:MOB kinase activator 1
LTISHFDKIQKLGETAHLNTAFKHFCLFIFEFDLVKRDELEPMKSVILDLLGNDYAYVFDKTKKKKKEKKDDG